MATAAHNFCFLCAASLLVAHAHFANGQEQREPRGLAASREETHPIRFDNLGDPLPPQARFQFGTERFVSQHPVFDIALSPDGKLLLTKDAEHINCWDTASGKVRWFAQLESQWTAAYGLRAFAFTGSGENFYSQSDPEKLLKWNMATGKSISIPVKNGLPLLPENRPVNSFPGATLAIDVTQDDSRIAASGGHGVVVYDAKGNSLFEIPNKPNLAMEPADWKKDPLLTGGHYSLALFSPDAKTLAVVTSDTPQKVRLLNASTGDLQTAIELDSRVVRMAFSPDSQSIGTTERNSAISQFSTTTGNLEWEYLSENAVGWKVHFPNQDFLSSAIAYSPDGKLVAAGVFNGIGDESICMLETKTGKIQAQLSGHTQKPWGLAFTADSSKLYSAGLDRVIRRWDVPKGKELPLEKGFHGTGIVASNSSGNQIALSDSTGNIHISETISVKPESKGKRIIETQHVGITSLALSRDGNLVASGASLKDELIVSVWNTKSSKVVHRWRWREQVQPTPKIGTLEFSPDGLKLAASVNGGGKAHLLDANDGKQIAELDHALICGLSFDHTGKQLVTAGANERLCFWDTATGKLLNDHEMIGGDLQNIRCSPVDDLIVTAHFPNVLRMWNSKDMTLRKRAPISGEANFEALAFSSDGNWLATGSSGIVNIFSTRTAERIWKAGSHNGRVLTLGFAERDRVLVSGGDDRMVYGWELMPQQDSNPTNYDQIWLALCNANDEEIKRLKWELVQVGDAAVDEVERRLKPITRVVNLRAISKGVDRETADSRVRMAMQLCEKNPTVEIDVRLKHVIDFLAMLRNPSSIALLERLSASHTSKEVRKEAMFALETIR